MISHDEKFVVTKSMWLFLLGKSRVYAGRPDSIQGFSQIFPNGNITSKIIKKKPMLKCALQIENSDRIANSINELNPKIRE